MWAERKGHLQLLPNQVSASSEQTNCLIPYSLSQVWSVFVYPTLDIVYSLEDSEETMLTLSFSAKLDDFPF